MKKIMSLMLLLVLLYNRPVTCMEQNCTSTTGTGYKIFAAGVTAGAAVVGIAWYWWHQKVNIPEKNKLMNSTVTLVPITLQAICCAERMESENKLLKEDNKRLMTKLESRRNGRNHLLKGIHRVQKR